MQGIEDQGLSPGGRGAQARQAGGRGQSQGPGPGAQNRSKAMQHGVALVVKGRQGNDPGGLPSTGHRPIRPELAAASARAGGFRDALPTRSMKDRQRTGSGWAEDRRGAGRPSIGDLLIGRPAAHRALPPPRPA
ncbi:MAG: hypothetical protein IPM99_11655 [Rubrivivax sp.]|nr:hypothetical protein [Rubrivivax sp.]